MLPLYVPDGLPDDERIAFEARLGTCRICQRELATFRPVFDDLAGTWSDAATGAA